MLKHLVRVARSIYRRIPFLWMRRMLYSSFAWVVRKRTVHREIDGMRYELDLGETIDLTLFLGEFERDIHDAAVRLCRPGMVVVDIGANVGAHTLLFAKHVAPGGRVIAFEATEYAFAKLVKNVSLNDGSVKIDAIHLALDATPASARVVDFRASWPTFGARKDGPSTVAFDTLDGWCARNGVTHVDLIKLDVDGYEYQVLDGARKVLAASHPPVLIECGMWHFSGDANPLALLRDHGYSFVHARTNRKYERIEQVAEDLPDAEASINVIAAVT